MREHPILFSGAMVRAILDGRKTQTRRVVKGAPTGADSYVLGVHKGVWGIHEHLEAPQAFRARCPYGEPGDHLWVRETHAIVPRTAYAQSEGAHQTMSPTGPDMAAVYREGWERCVPGKWRPSIHMPRWASRITLEVIGVRIERLQDISEASAQAEGCEVGRFATEVPSRAGPLVGPECHRAGFAFLWDSINAKGGHGWYSNPWVWVVEFNKEEA